MRTSAAFFSSAIAIIPLSAEAQPLALSHVRPFAEEYVLRITCRGNACGAISRYFENGCWYVQNNGHRAVNYMATISPGSRISGTIPRGRKMRRTFLGSCFRGYIGDESANFL
jgi:hypothetical protein